MNSLTKRICAGCAALLMIASVGMTSAQPAVFAEESAAVAQAAETEEASEEVTIADENLRSAICKALGKEYTEGVAITKAEMESLTELDCSNSDIADIEGIQYAVNLERLDLNNSKIASLPKFGNYETYYIQKLTKLKYLDISNCGQYATASTKSSWYMDALSVTASIKTLETIKAANNDILGGVYLSGSSSYDSLKTLDLSGNRITSLVTDSGNLNKSTLPSIEKIDLSDNGIFLDESSDGYAGYVDVGLDKFDFSKQKNLANIYAVYVKAADSSDATVTASSPSFKCDENGVFDLGNVYADTLSFALKGETCGVATTKAEVNGEKYTVVCAYTNNFDAEKTQITVSDIKSGENKIEVKVMNLNGDEASYTIKFNKVDVPVSESDESAGVTDPALYTAIMTKLGNSDYTHVITKSEMASLTGTLKAANVKNTNGIEYITSVTNLSLTGSYTDLPDLSNLKKITNLSIYSTGMTTVPDISKLTTLKYLYISVNSSDAWDISSLAKLIKIEIGSKNGSNPMVMPSGISPLKNLSSISIYDSNVTAITEKPDRTKSVTVSLYDCKKLTDISGLSGSALLTLNISDGCYVDFNTLSNVSSLSLAFNDVGNSVKLSGFGENTVLKSFAKTKSKSVDENKLIASASDSLTKITYKDNAVDELPESVYDCSKLTSLSVDSCSITSINDKIGQLSSLATLELKTTALTDLPEGTGKLESLTKLDLYGNPMTKLPKAIFDLENLQTLTANWSDLRNIDGDWGKLQKLTKIEFENCGIYTIPDNLNQASSLKNISLNYDPISSIKENAFDGLDELRSVSLGYYLKSDFNYDTYSFDVYDEDAAPALKKLTDRGVSVDYLGATSLSSLLYIETSEGNIYYKAHTDNQSNTVYVSSKTKSIDIKAVAAKSDSVLTLNGKEIKSGETVTVNDLKSGNNTIKITSKNECTPVAGSNAKTITYTLNVFVGDFIDKSEFPIDKHTYIVEGKILKQYDNTGSMAASYMSETFKVKSTGGKFAVDLTVNSNSWIPSMKYLDSETGEYITAQKISEDPANNTAVWRLYTNDVNKDLYISPYVVPMGYSPICRIVFDTGKITDITDQFPSVDLSDLNIAINEALAITEKNNIYTDESYGSFLTALENAQTVAGDTLAAQDEVDSALEALKNAMGDLTVDENKLADKTALKAQIDEAKALTKGSHTDSAWNALQEAIADAEEVYNTPEARQSEVDSAAKSLKTAVTLFNNSGDASDLDKNDLADGVYSVYVDMIKMDRENKSMSDNAINHIVKLEVKNGEYFVTLDFKGITIENRFGYLKNLSYYADGYTYGEYGTVTGDLVPAEVLSTQKDADGNDVIDQYNDEKNLYPDLVKIKLVPTAIADEEGYVPLHVFVPIMEAIAEGNGDQDVLMKIDWTSLKKTTSDDPDFKPDDPVIQSPAIDYTDSATGVKVHADKGVFEEGVKIVINEITSGSDYENAKKALAEANKFKAYSVGFENEDGSAASPNGTVEISIPIPEGYDVSKLKVYRINDNASKTMVDGVIADGYYTIKTKSAGIYAIAEIGGADDNSSSSGNSGSSSSSGNSSSASNSGSKDTTPSPATGVAAKTGLLAAIGAAFLTVAKKRKEK